MNQPGSPANRETVKEQRAAQRAKKLETYHRQQKRGKQKRRLGIIGAVVGGVAVIGLVAAAIILTPKSPTYEAGGGSGAEIKGVQTFKNPAGHVETKVTYPETPPAGGEHNPAWLNCGVYTEPVPNENAVHSLEHGAIWVTYDPSLSAEDLKTLKAQLPSSYLVLSPFEGLPSPIVLSGWNVQLEIENADDKRIGTFFTEHWQSKNVPEAGAPCTGAIDAPGKTS